MKNIIIGILVLIFAVSCSTQSVYIDYDRNQDFSLIKDYKLEFTENHINEFQLDRIQSILQEELQNKSLIYNENSENTIIIRPEEFITEEQNSHMGIGMGSGGRNFGTSISMGIPINSEKLNQHYLISINNAQNQLIWEGRLEVKTPVNVKAEALENNIKKGVQKLFKDYPPNQ